MSIIDLWQPILVSAAGVWLASAVVWMAMPWHKSDFAEVTDEEAARAALKGLAPGYYNIPHCVDMRQLKEPEMQKKFEEGPLAFVTIVASGVPRMGGKMIGSFVYYLVVGVICAYFVSDWMYPNVEYMDVFRIAASVAFVAHGVAYIQDSIWFARPWSITAKTFLDALIYALITGGIFGWLALSG